MAIRFFYGCNQIENTSMTIQNQKILIYYQLHLIALEYLLSGYYVMALNLKTKSESDIRNINQ